MFALYLVAPVPNVYCRAKYRSLSCEESLRHAAIAILRPGVLSHIVHLPTAHLSSVLDCGENVVWARRVVCGWCAGGVNDAD